MGICGCGDFQPDFKFKGPGDTWYVVQSYPSCNYCDTPAGIILYHFDAQDAEMWDLAHIKEEKILSDGTYLPVLYPKKLKEKFVKYLGKEFAEGLADELITECFVDAVHESFKD